VKTAVAVVAVVAVAVVAAAAAAVGFVASGWLARKLWFWGREVGWSSQDLGWNLAGGGVLLWGGVRMATGGRVDGVARGEKEWLPSGSGGTRWETGTVPPL
jgi:hypothetical protein